MCWYKRFRWGCGCTQGIMLWNRCVHRGTPQCRRRHLLERYHVSRYCQRHHLEALRFAAEAARYERSPTAMSHTTTASDKTSTATTTGTVTANNTAAASPNNSQQLHHQLHYQLQHHHHQQREQPPLHRKPTPPPPPPPTHAAAASGATTPRSQLRGHGIGSCTSRGGGGRRGNRGDRSSSRSGGGAGDSGGVRRRGGIIKVAWCPSCSCFVCIVVELGTGTCLTNAKISSSHPEQSPRKQRKEGKGRSDFHRHPPRPSARRQDLEKAGYRSSPLSIQSRPKSQRPPPLQADRE
ncbi:predicted protein [Chaetomium globosum CBS 148.51]|uniref:Uncharacterized protein n=1 Tax=Chaetomium globosum (strain ATCC 6205 / CBS 148.51 / DSM 1962 / NBRC 6347 / NRRL 1970) TaxID=306901 RepID=Q2HI59_CHAGB|nr:uncharacterized protein CHGG_00095 [Chaetomium globosum CBS 148.51]EAQ91860.1 predicted protein [Chaetomium globosum CBS 148.51]